MSDPVLEKAIILAAGRGTRMGVITEEIPKPMLPVHGRPMLELILERLTTAGVKQFLIVVGFQADTVMRHFKGWPGVEFVLQNPVNGTGSGTLLGANFANDSPFLLTYGDILCAPAEYQTCAGILLSTQDVACALAVKDVDDPWQGAAVYETNGRIERIIEKPARGSSTTRWNSAGFYGFRPVVFSYLQDLAPSPRGEYELTSALAAMLARNLDLRISPIAGEWHDVGRPEDLSAVNR